MKLRETQRRMAEALMLPLAPSGRIRKRTADGKLMSREAAAFIRPNRRLSSVERLEIYSRSYWFRLLGSLADDFPGLRAVIGDRAFERLAGAYLGDCPSRSFTLRDLGSRLEGWLRTHPSFAGRHLAPALDMVRLEWAHIVAFDGPEDKVLGPEDLIELTPSLGVGLQPYISLLDLSYPVDAMRIRVNADSAGSQVASNAAARKRYRKIRGLIRIRPESVFLAVHRLDLTVYYRRLAREEFRLLSALRARRSLAASIRFAFQGSEVHTEDRPPLLKAWFATWASFGWLTSRPQKGKGTHSS
jgi:hypothetical protein